MIRQEELRVETRGRGTYDLSDDVQNIVARSGVRQGICHLFVKHTSASLMLCENADPAVRNDLEGFMQRQAPDGDPNYTHTDEGPDDMSAHIRNMLTQSDLSIPVAAGRCSLGTWQGIYLWEHRLAPHRRLIVVTINGE